MKKLYVFASAIIGIYACVNLSSCRKDDKDEPKQPEASVKMRPTSITWYDEGEDEANWMFYNIQYSEGLKVLSYIEKDYGDTNTIEYQYGQNSITKTTTKSYRTDEETFVLSNGKIVSSQYYEYKYDGNHLLNTIDNEDETTYKWENDVITQRNWEFFPIDNSHTCVYSYTDYPMYVWIQTEYGGNAQELYENCDPFLVRQGLFGQIPIYLVKQMKEKYSGGSNDGRVDTLNLTYEFNEYGYPTKIIRDQSFCHTTVITWEKY